MQFQRIVCVCTGNICRSPLAAGLLKKQAPALTVSSAGIGAVVGGEMPAEAARIAQREALDLADHRGRQIDAAILRENDLAVQSLLVQLFVPRERVLRAVQTPQCFDLATLKAAFDTPYRPEFTDDASVMEAAGHEVHLCEGDPWNVKVTTPEDLTIAEAFVRSAWPQS